MHIGRFIAGTFLSLVAVYSYILISTNRNQFVTNALSSAFAEAPAWREVGRKVLLNQSWEMQSPSGWWVQGTPGEDNRIRARLEGRFAASDPTIKMIVLDKPNWEKWQMGYPPLSLGTAAPNADFKIPASNAGYYFGFFRQPPDWRIPASSGSVLLALLREYQIRNPSPVRMTARIILVEESLCTSVELPRLQAAFRGGR